MNIKDEIFEAYGEMKAEQDLLAVGYTALLGTSMQRGQHRPDAVQPECRRKLEGPLGARAGCARRRDGKKYR